MKSKIKDLISKIDKAITPYKKNLIIPLLKIIGIIIVCVVIARLMGGHETLAEYAAKNPDIAYGTGTVSMP